MLCFSRRSVIGCCQNDFMSRCQSGSSAGWLQAAMLRVSEINPGTTETGFGFGVDSQVILPYRAEPTGR